MAACPFSSRAMDYSAGKGVVLFTEAEIEVDE